MNYNFLLDLFYPPSCAACGVSGAWWCAACRVAVERLPGDPCPRCLSADADHDRGACDGLLPFSGVVATGFYHSPPLRKVISDVKYRGVTAAQSDLAAYLRESITCRRDSLPWAREPALAIQPMPLAAPRERERGFNQAALVADTVKEVLAPHTKVVAALARTATGTPQATIKDHRLRAANVSGTFAVVQRVSVPVLLVDDVVTTGGTAGAAARAILFAGAPRVYLFALALGA